MKKLIYILSPSYSGSTILDLYLGQQEGVCSLGEIHRLAASQAERIMSFGNRCSCGQRLHDCEYWESHRLSIFNQIGIRPNSDWSELSFQPETGFYSDQNQKIIALYYRYLNLFRLRQGLKLTQKFHLKGRNQWSFFRAFSNSSQADYLVDSSKSVTPLMCLASCNPESILILRLIRDGRGILYSRIKRGHKNIKKITKSWKQESNKLDRALKSIEADHIVVHYEDFCRSPNETVRKILTSCNSETLPDLAGDNSVQQISQHHSIPGSSILSQKILTPKLDNTWQEKLEESEIEQFNRYGKALNEKYGYS